MKRLSTIPNLIHKGNFIALDAIVASGATVYEGQIVKVVDWGQHLGGDFTPDIESGSNYTVPVVEPIKSADVATSGTTAIVSGAVVHKPIGVVFLDQPIEYGLRKIGKPLTEPADITFYGTNYDNDPRRVAVITPKDQVYLWLPFSGTSAPSVGDYLTLSSGVDGAVSVSADPINDIIVGKVLGYKTAPSFSGVTIPNVNQYVLTYLEFSNGA